MNLNKELSQNQIMVLIMPGLDYNKVIVDVMKKISGKRVCYVTLNKTSEALTELFKRRKIKTKDITFIDAISKTIKRVPDKTEGAYFVSSPHAMTEISIMIEKLLKTGFDYLIFDSLTNLLIYENQNNVANFVSSLANKIRQTKTKALFYTLNLKEQKSLIEEVSMFVDKAVELK